MSFVHTQEGMPEMQRVTWMQEDGTVEYTEVSDSEVVTVGDVEHFVIEKPSFRQVVKVESVTVTEPVPAAEPAPVEISPAVEVSPPVVAPAPPADSGVATVTPITPPEQTAGA